MELNDSDRLVRLKELVIIIGLSRSMVYLLIKASSKYFDPLFPRPIKISRRAIAWRYSEVRGWMLLKEQAAT